jgi:hypothetical protein
LKYFVLGIGAVAVCFFAIVFLALLAGAQREYFGNFDGNSLLSVEIAFVIVLIVTVSLWRQGKRFLGISIAFFGLSLFLAFLAGSSIPIKFSLAPSNDSPIGKQLSRGIN